MTTIPFDAPPLDSLSAAIDGDLNDGGPVCLLAHGAGAAMDHPLLVAFAERLAARGLTTVRFNYPYTERRAREGGRRPPDRMPKLLEAHAAALAWLREQAPERPVILGGKSMGGRVSSLLLAGEGPVPREELGVVRGAFFWGYPLHPPKKPDQWRTEHWPRLHHPCLFLQGTRDELCPIDSLERALGELAAPHELHVVEGGDHSLEVQKRSGIDQRAVFEAVADRVWSWTRALG
jgi:predicted alpha/beta-hydrolase family hydrolase